MADVGETTAYTDAATAIAQGKRHLLVQDYTAAVTALAEGLEMMSQKLGDCDDQLGEPYLLYGRALLGLAREEVGVLGGGVPGSDDIDEEDDEDCEEEDENDDEKTSDNETKNDEMETEDSETRNNEKSASANDKIIIDDNEKVASVSNKTDDKKIEEAEKVLPRDNENSEKNQLPGTSKDCEKNGVKTSETNNCNGKAGTSGVNVDEGEDVNKEDDDEDPGRGIDLQVAWEVLELAKIVFTKRGSTGVKHLAETHRLLGEVAMESDNPQGAIADLESALKLLENIEPYEARALADIHYQLGLAHSLANDFDASIAQFVEATKLLEARIKQLENTSEETSKSDNPFYTIEGEIKELRELLPAIQEKIVDMKDFKEEACRMVIEGIKNKVASGGCTNGSSSSASSANAINDEAASSEGSAKCPTIVKPASDISHLVRKKRKPDNETEEMEQSPCKKPSA